MCYLAKLIFTMDKVDEFAYCTTKNEDLENMVICKTHIGATNCTQTMKQYIWNRSAEGIFNINLNLTWQKLMIAARLIAGVEDPSNVLIVSNRLYGQRPSVKFAEYSGARVMATKWTPGMLTNQITKTFIEPRVVIVTDPRLDHLAIKEASYVNIPVIALCDTDSPTRGVDIAIPCNNKSKESIAFIIFMLLREVLYLRNIWKRKEGCKIMMDLFIHKMSEEEEKKVEEEKVKESLKAMEEEKPVEEPHQDKPEENTSVPAATGFEGNTWTNETAHPTTTA